MQTVAYHDFIEGDMAQRDGLGARPDGADDVAGLVGGAELQTGFAGNLNGFAVEGIDMVAFAELIEGDAVGPEGVGLDTIAAYFEEAFVDGMHPFGMGIEHPFGAVDELLAAPVGIGGVVAVQVGAHGPIEDEDTFIEQFQEVGFLDHG